MGTQSSDLIKIGGIELKFLADETHGVGGVVVFEFSVPPNERVPAKHYHRHIDEIVYGLEGTMSSTVDGVRHEIRRGDNLFIPRGRIHTHENHGPDTAKVLVVLSPGSIGRSYFEEIAKAVNVPGTPDMDQVTDIMLRHGLVPA